MRLQIYLLYYNPGVCSKCRVKPSSSVQHRWQISFPSLKHRVRGDKRQSMSQTYGQAHNYMYIYVKPSVRTDACPHVHGERSLHLDSSWCKILIYNYQPRVVQHLCFPPVSRCSFRPLQGPAAKYSLAMNQTAAALLQLCHVNVSGRVAPCLYMRTPTASPCIPKGPPVLCIV